MLNKNWTQIQAVSINVFKDTKTSYEEWKIFFLHNLTCDTANIKIIFLQPKVIN